MESTNILDKKGIKYKLIELEDKAISCDDVIKFSKEEINPDEICKTIIVKDKKGNKYAILLKAKDKIDQSKIKQFLGKVSIVSYEDLKKTTGKEPGAVCPLTLNIPIYVDKNVFKTKKINFGSGDHKLGIEINPKDLEKVIKFQEVDVS